MNDRIARLEAELRELWTAKGVPEEQQRAILDDVASKATPAALAAALPPCGYCYGDGTRRPHAPGCPHRTEG